VTNVVPPQILFLLNILFSKQKPHHPSSFTCDDHCKFSMCFGLTSISQQQKLRVGFCLFVCLFFCFFLCVFFLVVVEISGNFFAVFFGHLLELQASESSDIRILLDMRDCSYCWLV
jgi:hypothetical protein